MASSSSTTNSESTVGSDVNRESIPVATEDSNSMDLPASYATAIATATATATAASSTSFSTTDTIARPNFPTYSSIVTHGMFCTCVNIKPCSYALDGEMVRVTIDGVEMSRLARFSVVDCHGRTILDEFIQVNEPVTNYNTTISGIEPYHILASNGAITLEQLHSMIHQLELFNGKSKIVGHGLDHDFDCLHLRPGNSDCLRDTTGCRLLCSNPRKPRKLSDLVKERLNMDIQGSGQSHNSIEDAKAAMRLYLSIRERWERDIQASKLSLIDDDGDDMDADGGKHKSQQRLRHIVLKYSITDIFAPPILNELPLVPKTFESTNHYASIFRPLLVEENRTACKRQLELLSDEQPHEIEPGTSTSSIFEITLTQAEQEVDPLETGFILKVENPSQHQLAKSTLLPSSVLLVVEFGTSHDLSAHIRAFMEANLNSSGTPRILSGQHRTVEGDRPEYPHADRLRQFCQSLRFNPSQIDAVLAAANLDKRNGVLLIKGPPGTGKTNMTVGLLSFLTSIESTTHSQSDGICQYRVLCCAPTNVAGREIAQRFCNKFLTYLPNLEGVASSPTSHVSPSSLTSSSTSASHPSTDVVGSIHPQFASFLHQQPFTDPDDNNITLDLSQILLIGTERDIIPYGLEKEDIILKEAALAERAEEGEEDDQPGLILDGEEHPIGVGYQEEHKDDDIFDSVDIHQSTRSGAASTLHPNHILSLIYQDHRKRRLRLLFVYIQGRLVQGRLSGMFEPRIITSQYGQINEYLTRMGEWKRILIRIQHHLNDSSDLPYFGPTESRTLPLGRSPDITPSSGRKVLRRLLNMVLGSTQEMMDQLFETRKDIANQPHAYAVDWSLNSHLLQLRQQIVMYLTSFESLVSSWLLCLSDYSWSDNLLVLNARLIFSTVSCAARRCIESSEELLSTMHSRRRRPSTRVTMISNELYTIRPISCVVMDEAAQLCESNLPIVLRSPIERLILVGDPQQLPAVVMSIPLTQRCYHRSLYQRLSDQGWPVQLLNIQYRMHPDISRFPNQQFYEGYITDAPSVRHRHPIWSSRCTSVNGIPINTQKSNLVFDQPLVLLDLQSRLIDGFGESKDLLNSFYNKSEEECAIKLLHDLDKRIRSCLQEGLDYSSVLPITVGIIAPYRRQIIHFQQAIVTHFPFALTDPILRIRAATVDAFQGQECDIIIFSATRSNPTGDIGFVSNPNRFNVAITRAKHLLIVLGDQITLSKKSALWAEYIQFSKQSPECEETKASDEPNEMSHSRQVINAGQVPELAKLIDPKKQCLKAFLALTASSSRPRVDALAPGYGDILYEIQLCGGDQLNKLHKMNTENKKLIFNGWYQLLTGRFLTPNLISYHKRRLLKGIIGISTEWVKKLEGLIHILKVDRFYFVWSFDLQQADEYVYRRIVVWLITADLNDVSQAVSHRALAMQQLSDEYLELLRLDLSQPISIVKRKVWHRKEIEQITKMRKKEANQTDDSTSHTSATSTSSFTSSTDSSSSSSTAGGPISTGADPFSHAKFFTLNSQLVSVILDADDHELDPEFDLGVDETQIMNHDGALIILGRSSTGKTTIQLKRLLRNEIKSRILQQRLLASKLEGEKLNELAGPSTTLIVPHPKLESDTHVNPDGTVHQLLLTQSEQLCRHLIQDYQRKIRTTILRHPLNHTESKNENEDMAEEKKEINVDDEDSDHLARIPNDFRQLQTSHFPLFLTTKKLLLMLDGTCPSPYFQTDDSMEVSNVTTRSSHLRDIDDMLDYNFFALDTKSGGAYWPAMNEKHRKGLTPAQVWTEIFSIIKGQIGLVTDGRVLSEEEYQITKVSQIPSEQRSQVYQLFLQYQEIKKSRDEFDITDALSHITKQLSQLSTLGIPIHFVYCDEVQDLLPSQIALMKYFHTHPTGFVLAGDTAQSISVGVQFRFSTLKDIFFKYLANEDSNQVPEISKLFKNYRSHGGVLNLANSIVSLLISFFPTTMDKLPLETANTDGAKPKLIYGGTDSDATRLFGEFGADQVILVRDADAKRRLKKIIPISLILTIPEAKGLEFKEVLIYNFFTDSPTTTQTGLRLIYAHMQRLGLPTNQTPPTQDQRHLVLNTELKNFYVALTRAKWTVWIYETNPACIQPLVDLWNYGSGVLTGELTSSSTSLIDIVTDLSTLTIARESTPEEYREQGHKLFDAKRYEDAARFYDLAKEPQLVLKARAYVAYTDGQECVTTIQATSKKRMDKVTLAQSIRTNNPNNPLNKRASESFKLAAITFMSLHPQPLHDMAGKAYEQCGEFELAAQQYVLVKKFKRAIQLLLILKPPMYQQALNYAEQAQWYQKCFELAYQHELFFLDKEVDRCLHWLTLSRDAQLRSGFVLGVVHSLVSRRAKESYGSTEFVRYGKLITKFMSKCSKEEVESQVNRLELEGQDAIAAQILQEVDPVKGAQVYKKAGRYFHASELLSNLHQSNPTDSFSSTGSSSTTMDAVDLLLAPLRHFIAIPSLSNGPSTLANLAADQRQSLAQILLQLKSIISRPSLHAVEIDLLDCEFSQGNESSSSSAIQPSQLSITNTLTSLLNSLHESVDKTGSVQHRLKLFILIELLRYQLSVGLYLTESCQIVYGDGINFYSTLFDCDKLVNVTLQSLTIAERDLDGETIGFQAIEQLLGLVSGSSPQFKRLIGSFDDNVLDRPKGVKSVIDLLNDYKPASQALLHPNPAKSWDRFISVGLKNICLTMRHVLAATMRTIFTDTMEAILKLLPRMLPCDMPTEPDTPCSVCSRDHPNYLYLSDISYAQCIFSHLKHLVNIQRRITTLVTHLGARHSELKELKLESFNISQSIITLMLPTCTAPHLWPVEQRLKLRGEPNFRILFDQYCQQLTGDDLTSVEDNTSKSSSAISSTSGSQSQPAPATSAASILSLRTLTECLLASMHTITLILIPNDRIPPIVPTKSFEKEKEFEEEVLKTKQEAFESFSHKHNGWDSIRHEKQKKTKYLKLQHEMKDYESRIKQFYAREQNAFTIGSVANELAHALNYQSILQHASTLDQQLLSDAPITSRRRHHQPTFEPSRNDRLLKSVLDGSRALLKYYRDLIMPMTQPLPIPSVVSSSSSSSSSSSTASSIHRHPLCQSNVGYVSSIHSCCVSIFTFLHLCRHFIILLICYWHRFECVALPRSIILECMGDSASTKLYEFALKSAPLQLKSAIQPIDSLLHAFRDILTDLILQPNRLNGFCSELVGERFCRGSSSSYHVTTNWTTDGPLHAQIVTQTLHILFCIGLNHSRAGWMYSLRAIYDMPENMKQSLRPFLSEPLQNLFTQLRTPQSFEPGMRPFPPVCIDWSRKYTVFFGDGIRQFENSARQLLFTSMSESENPILVLAKSDSPKYFNVLKKFTLNAQTFSVSEITGINLTPLPPPPKRGKGANKSSVDAVSSPSSSSSTKEVDVGEVEELDAATTIGVSVIGMDKSVLNELMLEQSTTMTQAALKQAEELKQTALGILNTDLWKNRCRAWLSHVRAIRLMTPEQQLQRMHQRWIDQYGRDWNEEYKSAFLHRVPKLIQKVNQHLELALEFRTKQLELKAKEEQERARNQVKLTSSSTSESKDAVVDNDDNDLDDMDTTQPTSLVSSAAFLFQLRSSGDTDPYSLHRCHSLIRTLEECQQSLSIKRLTQNQDLMRLENDLQLVSTTILDVERMLDGKPIHSNPDLTTTKSSNRSSNIDQELEMGDEAVTHDPSSIEITSSMAAPTSSSLSPHSSISSISNLPSTNTLTSSSLSASIAPSIEQSQTISSPLSSTSSVIPNASSITSVPVESSPSSVVISLDNSRSCVKCGVLLPSTHPSEMKRCDQCRQKIQLEKKAKAQKQKQVKAEQERQLKEQMEANAREEEQKKMNKSPVTTTTNDDVASSTTSTTTASVTPTPITTITQNDTSSSTTSSTPTGPGAFLLTLGLLNENTKHVVADCIKRASETTKVIGCIKETLDQVKDPIDSLTLMVALVAVYLKKKDTSEAEKLIMSISARLRGMKRSSSIDHLRVRFTFLLADYYYQYGVLPEARDTLFPLLGMKGTLGEQARSKSDEYERELHQRSQITHLVLNRWRDEYGYHFANESQEYVTSGRIACHECGEWFVMTTAQFVLKSSAPFCSSCKKKRDIKQLVPGSSTDKPGPLLSSSSQSKPTTVSNTSVTPSTNRDSNIRSPTASDQPSSQKVAGSTTSFSLVSSSTVTASGKQPTSIATPTPSTEPIASTTKSSPYGPTKQSTPAYSSTRTPPPSNAHVAKSDTAVVQTIKDVPNNKPSSTHINEARHISANPVKSNKSYEPTQWAKPLTTKIASTPSTGPPATALVDENEWTTVTSRKSLHHQTSSSMNPTAPPTPHSDAPHFSHPPVGAHCFRRALFHPSYDAMAQHVDSISDLTARYCAVANGQQLSGLLTTNWNGPSRVDHHPPGILDILVRGGWMLNSERIHVQWTFTLQVTSVVICFDSIQLAQIILGRATKRLTQPGELRLVEFKTKTGSDQSTLSNSVMTAPNPVASTQSVHHSSTQVQLSAVTSNPPKPTPAAYILQLGLINKHASSDVTATIQRASHMTTIQQAIQVIENTIRSLSPQRPIPCMTLSLAMLSLHLENKDIDQAKELLPKLQTLFTDCQDILQPGELRLCERYYFLVAEYFYAIGHIRGGCNWLEEFIHKFHKSPLKTESATKKRNQWISEIQYRRVIAHHTFLRWSNEFGFESSDQTLVRFVDRSQIECQKCSTKFVLSTEEFESNTSRPFCQNCTHKMSFNLSSTKSSSTTPTNSTISVSTPTTNFAPSNRIRKKQTDPTPTPSSSPVTPSTSKQVSTKNTISNQTTHSKSTMPTKPPIPAARQAASHFDTRPTPMATTTTPTPSQPTKPPLLATRSTSSTSSTPTTHSSTSSSNTNTSESTLSPGKLATIQYSRKNYAQALIHSESAIKSEPNNVKLLINHVRILLELSRPVEALNYLDRVFKSSDIQLVKLQAVSLKARCKVNLGQLDSAIDILEIILIDIDESRYPPERVRECRALLKELQNKKDKADK